MNSKLGISGWAIRTKIAPIMLFILLTVAGIFCFIKLPVNANPSVDYPLVSVTIIQIGAAPAELENNITRYVEDAIASIPRIRNIQSTIKEQVTNTLIEFQLGVDINQVVNDVRSAINQIMSTLPSDIEEPIVQRVDISGAPILHFTVKSNQRSELDLSWLIDDTVIHNLLSIPGVEFVSRFGGASREISVEVDPIQLATKNVSIAQLNQQLQMSNLNLPGGSFDLGNIKQNIRIIGQQNTINQLKQLPITAGENRWIYLGEIADVKLTNKENSVVALLNEDPTVGFSIWRAQGYSDTEVENRIDNELSKIQKQYQDLKIEKTISTVDYTRDSYSTTMQTLIEGAILTVLVVYFFLKEWRATMIAAIALPLSIIPTFILMYILGFTLNNVSLLAITLATGILVDDAIVEIENIERYIINGDRPYIAALKGADNIGLAVIATTLSIVAIFIPVSFASGIIGLYFKQFGLTVAGSVLFSLLVARLITPLMAAYILLPHSRKNLNEKSEPNANENIASNEIQAEIHEAEAKKMSKTELFYYSLSKKALLHRKKATLFFIAFFALSIFGFSMLPTGFLAKPDKGTDRLHVQLPPTYSTQEVEHAMQNIAKIIKKDSDVLNILSISDSSNKVIFDISLKEKRKKTILKFEEVTINELQKIPNIRYYFTNEQNFREVSVVLGSKDLDLLEKTANQLEKEMKANSIFANIHNNRPLQSPELLVIGNPEQMARLGVTTALLANTLRIANIGDTDSSSAKFNLDDQQIPIRIRLNDKDKNNLETLGQLRVANLNGRPVPIASIADFVFSEGDSTIIRYNRYRQIALEADLNGATLGQATKALNKMPILKNLPNGIIRFEYGDAQYMDEMLESFATSMFFGVLLVYAILVLLFKDFFQPITIIITLPLSLGGAVIGLILLRAPVDLSAVIGLLMLMGIVTKNAILLIDFIISGRKSGLSRHEALLGAVRIRTKPIIMTTIAMIAGMVPAALGFGAAAEFRVPMSVCVITGLITSTFLSLVFVPVLYTYIDDFHVWLGRFTKNLTSVTQEDIQKGQKL